APNPAACARGEAAPARLEPLLRDVLRRRPRALRESDRGAGGRRRRRPDLPRTERVVDHRRERSGDRDRGAVLALEPARLCRRALLVPAAFGALSRYLVDPSCVFPSVDAIVTEDAQRAHAPGGGVLADLYERHAPAAGRLAYLLTGDLVLAEDLVQEAFVRVVGRFRHLRVPDAFEAYLRRTIVNLHTSQLRRRRLERAYLEGEGRAEASTTDPDVDAREELWRAGLPLASPQPA